MANGATTAGRTAGARDHRRTHPAEMFCRLVGPILILVGLAGFLADATFDTGGSIDGDSLLGFEVNGWHNLVHIATGALLLAGWNGWRRARTVALIFGLSYGLVTLIGLIDGETVLGLLPVNPADNILHLALSALAIIAALAPANDHADDDRMHRSSPGRATTGDVRSTATGPETGERADRFGRGVTAGEPRDRDRL